MTTPEILYSLKRHIGETEIVIDALAACARKRSLNAVNITVLLNQAATHIDAALSDAARLVSIRNNGG
jgi:hypothetical protein